MDFSGDLSPRPFAYRGLTGQNIHLPPYSVSGIHKAVVEGDLLKVMRCIKSGESVNKRGTLYRVSPLHMAVIFNKLEILDYLLAEEDVEVDARCFDRRTPLQVATIFGHIECVLKLIQAGCDINTTDLYGRSAVYESVYPSLSPLDREPQVGRWGNNILSRRLDILHILLYYNADANIPDDNDTVPFFIALMLHNEEAQKILLDYVDDFNRIVFDGSTFFSMLGFALNMKSPFVKDIIERGADVNCELYPTYRYMRYHCVFSMCLCHPLDSSIFKMVWERLRYNDVKIPKRVPYCDVIASCESYKGVKNTIDLLNFLNYDNTVPTFLPVIIESDNFETAVQFFSKEENYFLFVDKFAAKKFGFDQLTALTCRLLEHGYRASSYDIDAIFYHYGYCELFKILLYMDNDYSRGWLPYMAFTRLMCDIDYNLKSVADEVNDIPKETVMQLLEFSVHPRLINALSVHYSKDEKISAILGRLPTVPSLIDLARNTARKQIWQSFKITNICQFYTTIDHLKIPTVYKNILTFRRKLYVVK